VIGATTEVLRAVWAEADLRRVLAIIGSTVIDWELPIREAGRTSIRNRRPPHRSRALAPTRGACRTSHHPGRR
jgi:hypothetical protein